MNPQRLFLLYIHKLLTDSLDFEAVARDFASTNTRRINYFAIALTCRLFHLCIFLLFISENIQNVKSSPPAGREGEFPLPDPPPASQGEGPFLFSAPHLKNFLTALARMILHVQSLSVTSDLVACLAHQKLHVPTQSSILSAVTDHDCNYAC